MTMQQKITAVVTSVDIGTPIELNASPFMGGAGRNALVKIPVLPLTSTILLQGAGNSGEGVPAEGSSDWSTILTITSASEQNQEIELPQYIRWNTTVLDADGPNVNIYLEGVQ